MTVQDCIDLAIHEARNEQHLAALTDDPKEAELARYAAAVLLRLAREIEKERGSTA
jgi:hypothetical protein